jgi:hypothetical protein
MARKKLTKAYESVEGVPRLWGGRMRQDGVHTAVQTVCQRIFTNSSKSTFGHVKSPENQTQGM